MTAKYLISTVFIFSILLVAIQNELAWASLEPSEILLVANRNASGSVGLANYYMRKRGVPEENLVQLWVADRETVSRDDYERRIAAPVRRYLLENENGSSIRCILIMYGTPLRVESAPLSQAEEAGYRELLERRAHLQELIKVAEGEERVEIDSQLMALSRSIDQERMRRNTSASVDSELALVKADAYSLSMWIPNPFFIPFQNQQSLPVSRKDVLMVSRLDGPDQDTVKRIIHDSIETEKRGLKGTAYFDARWPRPDTMPGGQGYGQYDYWIHEAARYIDQEGIMPVVIEETSALFQPGECPEAALYVGWYSLARYVPAFEWQPGSVGYHIASQECQSLKRGEYWCKRMLEEGVAATLGPVGEPYVQAFPPPEIFFKLLTDGRISLAEVFVLSNPFWSWKMVLVGDPLYRPFMSRWKDAGHLN
ncbi:TIGR03790 family protein [Desulfonatronovibrio hydrogenovorans]|uniref:TIGR03790 family protein n=1 Tax=Desulfonatronovibrio hydrogenovorans TaxID=53245 RepID=UPI000558025B|nr:TIGR03790 family protein [Desulfonatronovibrio hydrogenovorans]